jgi:hypothetical protein
MGKGGPKFGFAAGAVPPKKGSIGRSPSPGPDAYSLDRSAIVANMKGARIGSSERITLFNQSKINNNPGPGAYN